MFHVSFSSAFVSQFYSVVAHPENCSPKLIPWFVSDVTPPDFKSTIPSLQSETFFPTPTDKSGSATPPNTEAHQYLQQMVARWQSYIDSGVFALSVSQELKLGEADAKVRFLGMLMGCKSDTTCSGKLLDWALAVLGFEGKSASALVRSQGEFSCHIQSEGPSYSRPPKLLWT